MVAIDWNRKATEASQQASGLSAQVSAMQAAVQKLESDLKLANDKNAVLECDQTTVATLSKEKKTLQAQLSEAQTRCNDMHQKMP